MCCSPNDHRTFVRAQHRCAPACPAVKLHRPTVSGFLFNRQPEPATNPSLLVTSLPHYFFLRLPSLISSISPPNCAQTTPPSSTHSLSSLISAKPRTRIPSPGTPKISPSAPPHNPQYKVDENPPARKGRSLPAHTTLPASSRHPLRPPENTPSPSSTPSDIPASCTDKRSHPTETSSANDPRDNESSSAHKTNSSAATWTTPTPIIVPQ
jgi:hypothetical protein